MGGAPCTRLQRGKTHLGIRHHRFRRHTPPYGDPRRCRSRFLVAPPSSRSPATSPAAKKAKRRVRESEHRTVKCSRRCPFQIYTTDLDGRITFFNEAAVEFAGRRPEIGEKWCVTWRLYHPDGTPMPHDQCPMALALKEGRAIRGMEGIAERPNGTRVRFIPYPTPLLDTRGAPRGRSTCWWIRQRVIRFMRCPPGSRPSSNRRTMP